MYYCSRQWQDKKKCQQAYQFLNRERVVILLSEIVTIKNAICLTIFKSSKQVTEILLREATRALKQLLFTMVSV